MTTKAQWRPWDVTDAHELARLAGLAREQLPIVDIKHDVEWLKELCNRPGKRVFALTCGAGDALSGIAPFEVYPSHLDFTIGEISLFSKRTTKYVLEIGPVVASSADEGVLDSCFAALRGSIEPSAVVFLEGVPLEGPMATLLNNPGSDLRRHFHVVPHGPEYLRCRIDWDGTVDAYLASLSKRTGKDLAKIWRKFKEEYEGRHELRRFDTVDGVGEFLKEAIPVSDKTYQKNLLGLGLEIGGDLQDEMTSAARKGYFVGYVLYVDGEAIAFDYGYIYGDCFYLLTKGYDPAWATKKIGMVLGMELLQDVEDQKYSVRVLDHMYGGDVYKERTSNNKTPERHYYLIPRSVSGAVLAKSMIATDRFSRWLGDTLAKYGLKDRIKRLIRRHSVS